MNAVLLLVHNCLDLTKKCVASIRAQDIPTYLYIVDNDSTEEGAQEWLSANCDAYDRFSPQLGVSGGWNKGLSVLFAQGAEYVLIPNSDTILHPKTYSTLLRCNVPFVTGVSCEDMNAVINQDLNGPITLTDGPDFSLFLIRREAWELIGKYDEAMHFYAQDLDYHIRSHRKGLQLANCHCRFYHQRSSTLRLAGEEERRAIQDRANADRAALTKKWGCVAWEESYNAMLAPELFGVEKEENGRDD